LNGGPFHSFVEPDVTSLNYNRLDGGSSAPRGAPQKLAWLSMT